MDDDNEKLWKEKWEQFNRVRKDIDRRKNLLRKDVDGGDKILEYRLTLNALKHEIKQKRLTILREGRQAQAVLKADNKAYRQEFLKRCKEAYAKDNQLTQMNIIIKSLGDEMDALR